MEMVDMEDGGNGTTSVTVSKGVHLVELANLQLKP